MAKETTTKYVVEVLLPQEERDKFKSNPNYGRGQLKGWNGEGKVYAKGEAPNISLTLELNEAVSFKELEEADIYSNNVSYRLYFAHPYGTYYPTRVIEIHETRITVGYASKVYVFKLFG